jgi:hypothetical protein
MKQKLFIFVIVILVGLLLAGLNAASYVQKEKVPDTEIAPNRSTYNPGSTGTQAFFALLSETGRRVVRWQQPVDDLAINKKDGPKTFVMVGELRKQLTDAEVTKLFQWVAAGGRLVLIDRNPPEDLVTTTAAWKISIRPQNEIDLFGADPADQKQMTTDTPAEKPVQPTAFTTGVNAVQPSRFASSIDFERWANVDTAGQSEAKTPFTNPTPTPVKPYDPKQTPLPPPPAKVDPESNSGTGSDTETDSGKYTVKGDINQNSSEEEDDTDDVYYDAGAPVVHVATATSNLLVEVPYGSGKVIYLADPYIVSNGGIRIVDNAQLAVNIVAAGGGLIAFDEYHHGYGSNNNRLFQYFQGTPVIAIFLQVAALIGLIFYSQSRRFARALPENEPDRLSKLEYVSAMAELQRRTRAFDLAIENIYTDFRRRTSRLFGVDNITTNYRALAALIAERIKADPREIEQLLFECEDIIHGEPTNRKETVALAGKLREIEERLGLRRTGREKI